jgi:hypothetical protein
MSILWPIAYVEIWGQSCVVISDNDTAFKFVVIGLPIKPGNQHICLMFTGISRDKWHKRRKTGGRREPIRKKRKFELGRPAAGTKVS